MNASSEMMSNRTVRIDDVEYCVYDSGSMKNVVCCLCEVDDEHREIVCRECMNLDAGLYYSKSLKKNGDT